MHAVNTERDAALNWAVLSLLALIWGTSFILMKKGLLGLSAMQVAALRISISMLALSPLLIRYLGRVPRNKVLPIFWVGLFGSGLPPFLFAIAQTRIDSALAGIMNAATPLFAFVIGIAFFAVGFHWLKLTGVLTGLAGAMVLVLYGSPNPSLESYSYGSLVLLATLCYGTSVNIIGRHLRDVNPLAITSVSFLMLGIPAIVFLFTTDFTARISASAISRESLGYVAILAVMGTATANILFFWLTQRTTALFASTVTYLIPIVALLWGVLDGEHIGAMHLLGMVLVLLGVYLSGSRANGLLRRMRGRET